MRLVRLRKLPSRTTNHKPQTTNHKPYANSLHPSSSVSTVVTRATPTENQRLYDSILAFDIDGGPCSLSFSKRLARENGWSEGCAKRVITEYKRFVFLTMTAGHVCTPSEQVDQAWHLHLCYTESYWTRFRSEEHTSE